MYHTYESQELMIWQRRKKTQNIAQSMMCVIGGINNGLKVEIMAAITKRISSPTSEYDAISPAEEVGSHAAPRN